MLLKFIKSNNIDFHNYSIFLNNEKVNLDNNIVLNSEDNLNTFFVKTYWFKTKEYSLLANHNQCIVKIENLLPKKYFLIIILIFAFLIALSVVIDTQLIWNITAGYSSLWLIFQLYIYTIGKKNYIKVNIEYS